MERVLIVTASIGSGHVRAAEAISQEVIRQYPDADVRVVDFMSSETAYLNAFLKALYLKMLDFVPNLYAFLYHTTSGPAGKFSAQNLIAWQMKHHMESLVRRYAPDVVICTHPFPAAAASCLKQSPNMHFLFVTVMTDYSVHQMWIYDNVDSYFVATEKMRQDLIQYGFDEQKVMVSGIPIEAGFHLLPERAEVLAELGLSDEWPIVLIMGGGLGLGGENFALEALEALDIPLQILVAAGQNVSLLREVKCFAQRSRNTVMAFGYTDQIRKLMAVANLLISKPGALTISEALAVQLPMVLHEPIPGPETENAVYQSQQGTAVWLKSDQGLAAVVKELLLQPERLDRMRQCARNCCRPFAARDIVLHIAGQIEKLGAAGK